MRIEIERDALFRLDIVCGPAGMANDEMRSELIGFLVSRFNVNQDDAVRVADQLEFESDKVVGQNTKVAVLSHNELYNLGVTGLPKNLCKQCKQEITA